MDSKIMNKVMKYLLVASGVAVFVGAVLQIQKNPNGDLILLAGLLFHFVISSFEINRLKQIIDVLKKSIPGKSSNK
jgi:hypothetical protein